MIIKLSKINDKEKILKAARDRNFINGYLHKNIRGFLNKYISSQEKMR